MSLLVRKLDLRAAIRRDAGDRIQAFDLSEEIAQSPDIGIEAYEQALTGSAVEEIPAGAYLFAQTSGEADVRTLAWEAREVQKEGLWKAIQLDTRLYLRILAEERGPVHQLLRRIRDDS